MNDPHVSPVELSATSDASPRPRVPRALLDFGRGPLRILVAEDNRTLRRLLSLVLRRDGHDVAEACDAGELLEALASSWIHHRRRQRADRSGDLRARAAGPGSVSACSPACAAAIARRRSS